MRLSPAHAFSPRPHARSFASPARTTRTRNRNRFPGGGFPFHFDLTPPASDFGGSDLLLRTAGRLQVARVALPKSS
eukprot:12895999-Alexandrium_andersonii.AAC.1